MDDSLRPDPEFANHGDLLDEGNNITYRSSIGSLTYLLNARPDGRVVAHTLIASFLYTCLHICICSKVNLQSRFPNVNSMANICLGGQRKASR